MSHIQFTLLRKRRGWSWTKLPWPTSLLLIGKGKGVKDESPPLHPTKKEKRMVIGYLSMVEAMVSSLLLEEGWRVTMTTLSSD